MTTKKKPAEKSSKKRKFSQELPCRLSPAEYEKNAEELGKEMLARDLAEEAIKAAAKKAKDELTSREVSIERRRKIAETHCEQRMIECESTADFGTNRMLIIRLDTEEIVDERAMTIDERAGLAQTEMPVLDGEDGDRDPEVRA
jgi:hypothetical protein